MPTQAKLPARWIWTTGYSLLAILVAYGLLTDSTPNRAVAQNAERTIVQGKLQWPKNGANKHLGPAGCARCHFSGTKNLFGSSGLDFAAQNEASVVGLHDKHFLAYWQLETDASLIPPDEDGNKRPVNKLSVRMENELKKWKGDDYKLTTDASCLACHGDLHQKPNLEESVVFGVTCESCHGPGSNWNTPHQNAEWRTESGSVKAELGFIDVRNPAKRAQMCFSCHIGNVEQGKIVTHEMYAVGHPPLPGVEIETFVSKMPTHWRTIREKGDFVNRPEWIEQNLGIAEADVANNLEKSKATLISGVMALRESVNLFVTGAEKSEHWPDFAAFDCLACHHDLKGDSWRQNRGYAMGVPGRPLPYAWPTALVKLAIRQANQGDDPGYEKQVEEFEAHLKTVYSAALKSPFGDPEDMKRLGLDFQAEPPKADPKNLVEWLDQLAANVHKSKLDKAAAKVVLNDVINLPSKDYPDYHSARQLIWAFRTINTEMQLVLPKFKPGTKSSTAIENLKILTDWREQDAAKVEAAVDAKLAELGFAEQFFLKELGGKPDAKFIILPAGQKHVIADYVPSSLKMISEYDQKDFKAKLSSLKSMIETD